MSIYRNHPDKITWESKMKWHKPIIWAWITLCCVFAFAHAQAQTIIAEIPIPASADEWVKVNPTLNKIYVSGGAQGGQQVVVIDGNTFSSTTIGAGSDAHVDALTNRVWAAGVYSGGTYVYDGITNGLVANIGLGNCPISTSVDSVRRLVWVTAQCGGGNDPLWAIDADTFAVVAGPIGSGGVGGNIYANSATGRAYFYSGWQKRIDPTTFTVTSHPFNVLAINTVKNQLYARSGTSTLQVVDGAPDPEVLLASVPLSFPFYHIGMNTLRNRIYIPDLGGSLEIFDGSSYAGIGSIPFDAGVQPRAIAVDPTRDRIYLIVYTASGSMLYVIEDAVPVLSCEGFEPPLDQALSMKKKGKRAVPVKMILKDSEGTIVDDTMIAPPVVEVAYNSSTGSGILGYDGDLLPAGLSDDGNEFRFDAYSSLWVINLGMKAYTAAGEYSISAKAGDSSYSLDGCVQTITRRP